MPATDQVQVHFTIPREWHSELVEAANGQAISFSDLCRLILRGFLRNRYPVEEQEVLR